MMIAGASATAVATLGLVLACISLGWNVVNTIRDRRARRRPDLHAAVVVPVGGGDSSLVFANAGEGMARHVLYLLVEDDHGVHGGLETPYLKADETATVELPSSLRPTLGKRSALVWVCMDRDGNVYARSNKNDRKLYKHPAMVKVADVFREFYPGIRLPPAATGLSSFMIGE